MKDRLQQLAMSSVDRLMAALPRSQPTREALLACKLISHRGEHDNCTVLENTLRAYEIARDAGVWGIEFDVRWTADLVPVICHDRDTVRVFDEPETIAEIAFGELRKRLPRIPTLAEVIAEFGGNTHLMIELKAEPFTSSGRQRQILREQLAGLEPCRDFHILALDPLVFELVDFLPPETLFPVAETNVHAMSELSLEHGYGGIGGHYLLLGEKLRRRHAASGQRLGTGFPSSRNCLFREINRGIEWVFSNDAVALQGILDECLAVSR